MTIQKLIEEIDSTGREIDSIRVEIKRLVDRKEKLAVEIKGKLVELNNLKKLEGL
jgi:predicted  nucleic acid-binding Zn-ribbon protein